MTLGVCQSDAEWNGASFDTKIDTSAIYFHGMAFNLLRGIFMKNQQKQHRSSLTESVSKVAPIELLDSAFESADASEHKSQPHRVSMFLPYAFSKA